MTYSVKRHCTHCGIEFEAKHPARALCVDCRVYRKGRMGRLLGEAELKRAILRLRTSEEMAREIAAVFKTTSEQLERQIGKRLWDEIMEHRAAMRSPDTGVAPMPWRYAGRANQARLEGLKKKERKAS